MYSFNATYLVEKLTPPALRQARILAYLRVLTVSLSYKWLDFLEFINSSSYPDFDISSPYTVGDRVKYGYAIYECVKNASLIIPYGNPDYWLLINKDFVGIDARRKFNSQKIVFEYVLNLYLNTTPTTIPLIYTTRNTVDANGFYIGSIGYGERGELAKQVNQNDFIGTGYTLGQYAMTIYVPLALYNSLATTANDREQRVRNVADKYVMAGITYNVLTY
jgi:hypothetical protein